MGEKWNGIDAGCATGPADVINKDGSSYAKREPRAEERAAFNLAAKQLVTALADGDDVTYLMRGVWMMIKEPGVRKQIANELLARIS